MAGITNVIMVEDIIVWLLAIPWANSMGDNIEICRHLLAGSKQM